MDALSVRRISVFVALALALMTFACRALEGPAPAPSATPVSTSSPAELSPVPLSPPVPSTTVTQGVGVVPGPLVAFADMQRNVFYFMNPRDGQRWGEEVSSSAPLAYANYFHVSRSAVTFLSNGALHVLRADGTAFAILPPEPQAGEWDGEVSDAALSPNEQWIVWLFEKTRPCDSFPCPRDGWLVLTRADGSEPSLLLSDRGDDPDLHYLRLLSWREDDGAFYIARPPEMLVAAYFDITPVVVEVAVPTGEARSLSRWDDVGESAVSPDGRYLAEEVFHEVTNDEAGVLMLSDLQSGMVQERAPLDGYFLQGDFHFSPTGHALVWTEVSTSAEGFSGPVFATRLCYPGDDAPPTLLFPPASGDERGGYPHVLGWLDDEMLVVYRDGAVYAFEPGLDQSTFLSEDEFLGIVLEP